MIADGFSSIFLSMLKNICAVLETKNFLFPIPLSNFVSINPAF